MNARLIYHHRALTAYHLHHNHNLPVNDVALVLRVTKDGARGLLARAERIKRDLIESKVAAKG